MTDNEKIYNKLIEIHSDISKLTAIQKIQIHQIREIETTVKKHDAFISRIKGGFVLISTTGLMGTVGYLIRSLLS